MTMTQETRHRADVLAADEERLVTMLKALANPVRFGIVRFLARHTGCITNDIVAATPLAQATVSQHLKVLREAGLIDGTVEGPATCYCVDREALAWLRARLVDIVGDWCEAEACGCATGGGCCEPPGATRCS